MLICINLFVVDRKKNMENCIVLLVYSLYTFPYTTLILTWTWACVYHATVSWLLSLRWFLNALGQSSHQIYIKILFHFRRKLIFFNYNWINFQFVEKVLYFCFKCWKDEDIQVSLKTEILVEHVVVRGRTNQQVVYSVPS